MLWSLTSQTFGGLLYKRNWEEQELDTNSMEKNRSLENEDNQTKHKQEICTVSRKEEE
jgi:hypothetical protein